MNDLQVGDSVVVRGETLVVGGFSPASVEPTLVFLNDPLTGERVEVVLLEELREMKRRGRDLNPRSA